MMKKFSSTMLALAVGLLVSCGGTKTNNAPLPANAGEFDASTGTWKPLAKKATPPPHEQGAVITEQKKPGMMSKVGRTLKKPLEWVGLAKDEPQPAPATTTPSTTTRKTNPAQ